MKKAQEVMEILEACDLTGTLRGAAELAGCDHKMVAHWVRAREEAGGGLPVGSGRGRWWVRLSATDADSAAVKFGLLRVRA